MPYKSLTTILSDIVATIKNGAVLRGDPTQAIHTDEVTQLRRAELDQIHEIDESAGTITSTDFSDAETNADLRGTELQALVAGMSANTTAKVPHNSLEWPTGSLDTIVDANNVAIELAGRMPLDSAGDFPKVHGKLTATIRSKPYFGPPNGWLLPHHFGIFPKHTLQDADASTDDWTAAFNDLFSYATYYGLNVFIPEGYYRCASTVEIKRENSFARQHWPDLYDRGPSAGSFLGQIVMQGWFCAPYATGNYKPVFKTDMAFRHAPWLRARRLLSSGDTGSAGWEAQSWGADLDEATVNGTGRTYWQSIDDQVHNHIAGNNQQLDCGVLLDGFRSSECHVDYYGVAFGVLCLADGSRDKNISRSKVSTFGIRAQSKIGVLVHGRSPSSHLGFQKVVLTGPTAGTFTLTVDAQTTGNLAWDISAASLKSALGALSTVDSVGVTLDLTSGTTNRTYYVVFNTAPAAEMTINDSLLTATGTSAGYQTAEGWANANEFDLTTGSGNASTSAPAGWYAAIAFTGNMELNDQYFHHGNVIRGGDVITVEGGGRIGIGWLAQSCKETTWYNPWVEQGEHVLWCAKPSAYPSAPTNLEVERNFVFHDLLQGNVSTINRVVRGNGRYNVAVRLNRTSRREMQMVWDATDLLDGLVFSGSSRGIWSGTPKFGMVHATGNWSYDGSIVQQYYQPCVVTNATDLFTSVHTDGGTTPADDQDHGFQDGDQIRVTNLSGSQPGGVSSSTIYYVVQRDAGTFKISATRGGSPVSISSDGSNVNVRLGRTAFRPDRKYCRIASFVNSPDSWYPGIELHIDIPNEETRVIIERVGVEEGLTGETANVIKGGRVRIAGFDGNGTAMNPGTSTNGRWSGNAPVHHGTVPNNFGSVWWLSQGSDGLRNAELVLSYDNATPLNSCHRLIFAFTGGTKSMILSGFRIRVIGNRTARFVIPNSRPDHGATVLQEPQTGWYATHSSFRNGNPSVGDYFSKLTAGNWAVRRLYVSGEYFHPGETVYTGSPSSATIWYCVAGGTSSGATPDVDTTLEPDDSLNRWIQLATGVQIATFETVGALLQRTWSLFVGIDATTGTDIAPKFYMGDEDIVEVAVTADVAPVGADAIGDINLEGTTIFTTQSNRITILDGATEGITSTIENGICNKGDILSIDWDQIGSSTAGQEFTVTVWSRPR